MGNGRLDERVPALWEVVPTCRAGCCKCHHGSMFVQHEALILQTPIQLSQDENIVLNWGEGGWWGTWIQDFFNLNN